MDFWREHWVALLYGLFAVAYFINAATREKPPAGSTHWVAVSILSLCWPVMVASRLLKRI